MQALSKSCYVILGLLAKGDKSGYDLKRILNKLSVFYWSESNAQIYPVLKILQSQKLVSSRLDKASGARRRRIFHITPSGKKILQVWLAEAVDLTPYREELLLKLSLGQFLSSEQVIVQLRHYEQEISKNIDDHLAIIEHLKIAHTGRADRPFLLAVHEHVHEILQTKLRWCEKTLKQFVK